VILAFSGVALWFFFSTREPRPIAATAVPA